MQIDELLAAVDTSCELKARIHAVREQFIASLDANQRLLFMQLDDLYTEEDAEHLTTAYRLLAR